MNDRSLKINTAVGCVLAAQLDMKTKKDIIGMIRLLDKEPIEWNEVDVGFCPNCMSRDHLYSDSGYKCNFCGNCGQALDWEDGE